jgi:hypothetical protein
MLESWHAIVRHCLRILLEQLVVAQLLYTSKLSQVLCVPGHKNLNYRVGVIFLIKIFYMKI